MDSSNIIKVTVKTLKQKEQFEVAQSSTIQEFKEEVAKRFKTRPDLLLLVFAGKILNDKDTLSQHGIHSGVSIHVVIRSQNRPQGGLAGQRRATTPMQPPSHSNSNLFYLGSTADLQTPCLITHHLMDVLTSSQQVGAQSMESLLSGILSSDLDLNTVNKNAFLLGFLLGETGAPLLGLNSTDMLDILLESIPEGYSALEQYYREIEELIFNAVQAELGNNLLASVDSNPALSGARLPARTENQRPLPNPWALPSTGVGDNEGDCDDKFAGSGAGNSLGPAVGAEVPMSEKVQNMVQQLSENPELMLNLATTLTNPNDPAQTLLNSACTSSEGNSPPQDQWMQPLPPEMGNVKISSLLRNPRALQALLQIQLGLQTLSREVPEFMSSLRDLHGELDEESMGFSAQSEEPEDEAILTSDEDEAEGQMEMDEEVPQTRFKRQMEQLSAMGFQDQRANLQALIDAEGDVGAAAETLAKAASSNKIP